GKRLTFKFCAVFQIRHVWIKCRAEQKSASKNSNPCCVHRKVLPLLRVYFLCEFPANQDGLRSLVIAIGVIRGP
uniref:Uncharacterized protein n=1 Tax=Ciona intestinalis TaxID=7719 RepID=H2XUT5_CIOIN